MYDNPLIFGKDIRTNIVSVEADGSNLVIFKEVNGNVESEVIPNKYWLITNKKVSSKQTELKGEQYYKYLATFDDLEAQRKARQSCKKAKIDFYDIWDLKESALVFNGMTYFKGLNPKDVSILFFDIETTGLVHNKDSKVLLISNTFRKNGKIIKKLFAYDEYKNDADMLESWCRWVREMDPSIMCGHNILGYDLNYLYHCSNLNDTSLKLGRDKSEIKFNQYTSAFRKDGSQSIDYYNCHIYGREIVDTMFLSYKYDIGRKYESYGLKAIIKHEGLEKKGRVFYDAGEIRHKYKDPEEWKLIKEYACFAPNSSLITMEDGSTKLIEHVENGDSVISHDGSIQYVYNKLERDYCGELLSFNLEGGRKIHKVTPEHPFYVLNEETLNYEWVKAGDLKINHLLVKGFKKSEKNSLSYKEDDFWLFGLYQGDGYVRLQQKQSSVVITQHCNEAQQLINVLQNLGYTFSIVKKSNSKAVDIVISNNQLAQKFLQWSSGKFKCYDKKISKEMFEILNGNKKLFLNFLAGIIDSDGHIRKTKKTNGYQMHLCISSPHLTNIIDILCNTHGINLTRQNFRTRGGKSDYINGKLIRKKTLFYELTFFKNSMTIINKFLKTKQRSDLNNEIIDNHVKHVRIIKIEKEDYVGKVYNISVTNTHSYISNGIISHNCDDADDAMSLFDLMVPAYFYFTQSVSKSFQQMINSATGSQINNLMTRSYLQNSCSIAKADEAVHYEGAISVGFPGVYRNSVRWDAASLYPSIMRQYRVESKKKDPEGNFLKLVDYFTLERLKNKKLAKETGNKYYKDLEQTQKIAANSMYGFLGAPGLLYNFPEGAALVTRKGRQLLERMIKWASGKTLEELKFENTKEN